MRDGGQLAWMSMRQVCVKKKEENTGKCLKCREGKLVKFTGSGTGLLGREKQAPAKASRDRSGGGVGRI